MIATRPFALVLTLLIGTWRPASTSHEAVASRAASRVTSSVARRASHRAPIIYALRFPNPSTHTAMVDMRVPTDGAASVEVMMAAWSPGFYRVENYATRLDSLSARTADGRVIAVEHPAANRWRFDTRGTGTVTVTYRLQCAQRSVTTNWVSDSLAVINGPATFLTRVETGARPVEVHVELAPLWTRAMTSLDAAADGLPNHFRADSYDILVDSPIVAGDLAVHDFVVDGSRHYLVDAGDRGSWDGARGAGDLKKFVEEDRRFWGFLPFRKYVFLNVFRQGGGGLEHLNSTLLTSNASRLSTEQAYVGWLGYVSHEYFHAFNVKRLRPVELGPFDYEHPPSTTSLWISEGLTSYFGELFVSRSGLANATAFLSALSNHIAHVQTSPGRLVQSLEQSSLAVWTSGTSGVGQDPATTVSYYEKGPIVGWMLDAKIRRATKGRKSIDDLMRLAYKRYSGAHGFTAEQFVATASSVAGVDLRAFFHSTLATTEELDYTDALDWFGLRFVPSDDAAKRWVLEVRPDANTEQRAHFAALMAPSDRR